METIFALSSGSPPAAIAVVRVSGPLASEVLQKLGGSLPQARQASARPLPDENGDVLDFALVSRTTTRTTTIFERATFHPRPHRHRPAESRREDLLPFAKAVIP